MMRLHCTCTNASGRLLHRRLRVTARARAPLPCPGRLRQELMSEAAALRSAVERQAAELAGLRTVAAAAEARSTAAASEVGQVSARGRRAWCGGMGGGGLCAGGLKLWTQLYVVIVVSTPLNPPSSNEPLACRHPSTLPGAGQARPRLHPREPRPRDAVHRPCRVRRRGVRAAPGSRGRGRGGSVPPGATPGGRPPGGAAPGGRRPAALAAAAPGVPWR
jgi:hypothetical protein